MAVDGRIWCIGGVGENGYQNVVEVYDPATNQWATAPSHPTAKAWMGAAAANGLIYVAGGANSDKTGKNYNWLDETHVFVPDPVAAAPEKQIAVTWWGGMSVEVNVGRQTLVFDPYVKPERPRVDYIFCSHPHYDHCHQATLRRLVTPTAGRLKMLFAARGCFYASQLEGPTTFTDEPLTDLDYIPRDRRLTMVPKFRHDHEKPFTGVSDLVHGRFRIEAFRSDEDPVPKAEALKRDPTLAGPWPNLGFLVTDTVTGFGFAHTGDLWRVYPQMREMRGRVDQLLGPDNFRLLTVAPATVAAGRGNGRNHG